MPRRGSDEADGDADSGTGDGGYVGIDNGADVFGYARIECEQRSFGRDGQLHEPGGNGGVEWRAYVHVDYVSVCGYVDCTNGLACIDGDTDGTDGDCGRQFDEDRDHGLCARRDLHGMVVRRGGNNCGYAVL